MDLLVSTCLVVILPMLGALLSGKMVSEYFSFPPRTQFVQHAGFSPYFFWFIAVTVLAIVLPFIRHVLKTLYLFGLPPRYLRKEKFPWWGWFALILLGIAWLLAWTRFSWYSHFQKFAFATLWFPFVVVVNAVTFKRTRKCLMLQFPARFIMLFPVSAGFWWLFEYLNRFVHNWYYVGVEEMSGLEYCLFATVCFSTVLPAVASINEYLSSRPALTAGLDNFVSASVVQSHILAVVVFIVSVMALLALPVFPDYLFPALWLSPLALVISIQILRDKTHIFSGTVRGNWRIICQFALAGLICGFFWELWNYGCLVKWKYSVPFVDRFHIFEMPVLGYAGYLPFGLECAIVIDIVMGNLLSKSTSPESIFPISNLESGISCNR